MYKNDLKLCKIIETNQAFSEVYKTNATRPLEAGIPGSQFYNIADQMPEDLTNERVYSIICRWQGLRILQNLYLDPVVGTKYSDSIFPYVEDDNPADTMVLTKTAAKVSRLPDLSLEERRSRPFNARQTQRFYKALTSYWFAVESHWLLRRSVNDTWEELWKLGDLVEDIWSGKHSRDFLESVDVIEVFDFVYGFLLRVIFPNAETARPWLGLNRSYFESGSFNSADWRFLVQNCRLFLRPAHIIKLLAMACPSAESTWPRDKMEYLQLRGAFEISEGTARTDHPDGRTLDFWFDIRSLEEGARCKLGDEGPVDDANLFHALWRKFRSVWKLEARWTLFWWANSSDDVVARIQKHQSA